MKSNILVVMFTMILALTFSFTFTSCKKADTPASVVTDEKKTDAAKTGADKTDEMKKEVDNASGFNFK